MHFLDSHCSMQLHFAGHYNVSMCKARHPAMLQLSIRRYLSAGRPADDQVGLIGTIDMCIELNTVLQAISCNLYSTKASLLARA
jgi:hypothetical protein